MATSMEINCGEKPPKSPSLYPNSMTPYELTSPLSSPPSVPPQNSLAPANNTCPLIPSNNQHSSNLSSSSSTASSSFYPPTGAPTAVDYNLHVTSLTVNYPAAAFAASATDGANSNSLYMPGMNHMAANPLVAYQNYPYYPNPTCGATPSDINQHHHLLPSAASLSPYNPYYPQMSAGSAAVSYGSSGSALSNSNLQGYNCAAPVASGTGHQSEWHLGFLPNPLENRILSSSRLESDVELKTNSIDTSQHFRIATSRNMAAAATSSLSNKLLIPVTSNPGFDGKGSDAASCHETASLSTPGSKVFAWMSKRPSKHISYKNF